MNALTASRSLGRQHSIVDKDYYRMMQTQKILEKRGPNKAESLQKFKSRAQLLVEEYAEPSLPREQMYMIDKVVRMRGLQGRYGVDHSEILNYEFEMANKQRQDHMNLLVYKGKNTS